MTAWALALTEAAMTSPQFRAEMGAFGRARARRLYSLDAMCAATLEVYRQVAERSGQGAA